MKKYFDKTLEAELLASAREMEQILQGELEPARITTLETPDVREARNKLKLPRAEFARIMGVSPRTVEGWEQGRRQPKGAVSVLLRLALSHPKIVQQALKN